MVCTEDPKRSIGLWHGVMAAVYNGMHMVYVPPNLMSAQPVHLLQSIQRHKGKLTDVKLRISSTVIYVHVYIYS